MTFEYERVLVVANPFSTSANAEKLQTEIIRPLRTAGIDHGVLETMPPDGSPYLNREAIKRELRPGDLVISCGGDGSVNEVANSILASDIAGEVGLAAAPFGRANDLARGINGGEHIAISSNLKKRRLDRRPVGVIAVEAASGKDVYRRYGVGYVGLGLTAILGANLNSPDYRARRQKGLSIALSDITSSAPTVLGAERFSCQINSANHKIIEALCINNAFMARYFRFNKSIFDNNAFMFLSIASVPDLAKKLLLQRHGQLNGENTERLYMAPDGPVAIQFDGEVKKLAAETNIELKFVPSALGIVACRNI